MFLNFLAREARFSQLPKKQCDFIESDLLPRHLINNRSLFQNLSNEFAEVLFSVSFFVYCLPPLLVFLRRCFFSSSLLLPLVLPLINGGSRKLQFLSKEPLDEHSSPCIGPCHLRSLSSSSSWLPVNEVRKREGGLGLEKQRKPVWWSFELETASSLVHIGYFAKIQLNPSSDKHLADRHYYYSLKSNISHKCFNEHCY